MKEFAKLFQHQDIGQVLVVLDSDDEGPVIGVQFKPDGLGVCAIKLGFPDSEEGWDLAEQAFCDVDEEKAFSIVRDALNGPISAFNTTSPGAMEA